ncbi:MAG: hypothetical protein AAFY17_08670 [Cyanobacteria bacterium J06642_11]
MSKFVLGGILAAISLMVIYGASASNRVTSWMDRDRTAATPVSNDSTVKPPSGDGLLALNTTETSGDSLVDVSGMTPLEKAGTLPQRQTIGAASNFGGTPAAPNTDDTDGEVVTPNPQETETPNNDTAATPPTTTPAQTPATEPIRALW